MTVKSAFIVTINMIYSEITIFSHTFRNFNFSLGTLDMQRENDFSHAIREK